MEPKTTTLAANGQDRLATWDEIRRATFTTPDHIMQLYYTTGGLCEIDSESGGRVRFPAEEFEFFAYMSDLQNPDIN